MEIKDCILSSGTLASLTGEKNDEELERIQWEFLDFVRKSKAKFNSWTEAWTAWEQQKSEEAQEPPLFEHTKSPKPSETLRLSGAETTVRRKSQPDYSQFGLPGFGPRFGEIGKAKGNRKKRTPINQLQLGM